ncbi:MAG: hypothetical protein QM478_03345 [Flavobacteriaceae bacterium]
MNNQLKHIIFFLLLSIVYSYGQISPGDLSKAHAELEGMSNCTQCHELGEKVLNSKCLECHEDIQALISNNKGYHADVSVVKKDCFECHSEHHGRKFDMVRFNQDNFDHELAGYELEGEHDVIDCRKCHTSEYIQNPEIKKRNNTFLGLEQDCLSCHDDFHQETLTTDCVSCHDMDGFKPASNFDHKNTDYQLKGKHIEVDCVECHKITNRNGVEYQEFSELSFNDCVSCHDDPHTNQLAGKCVECHTENSFSIFIGKELFNHNTTDFTLRGAHNVVDCFVCHKETGTASNVFQDNISVDENNCVQCHDDSHDGKYELDCVQCHNEKSFLTLNNMDFFDHSVADYDLKGEHLEVDCKQCHVESYSKAIDFSACKNCHDDYHREEFSVNGNSPDCVECHSLEQGFEYGLYTLEQHQETIFPLDGAHVATPCFACHISEEDERWTFRQIGEKCVDCHQDIHEDAISAAYYPEDNCTACHSNESWSAVTFDHNNTNWALEGKHKEIECRDCHFKESKDNNLVTKQEFNNLDTECISCHSNIHGDSFAIEGETDCNRCHITSSWLPEKFNHNETDFPLLGEHTKVDCRACHTSSIVNDEVVILYKLNKFECIDCHQ